MKPIPFDGQTIVLGRPDSMTDEECESLPILRLDNTCISCWRMTWRERIKVLATGVVWLGILSGKTQPPCYTAIDKPFQIVRPSALKSIGFGLFIFRRRILKELGCPRYIAAGYRQIWWRIFRKDS